MARIIKLLGALLCSTALFAQPLPPEPAPLDGGLLFLGIGGAVYAAKQVHRQFKPRK